jgi:tRNA(Ile)-lysidine synthase TilS/MesJ
MKRYLSTLGYDADGLYVGLGIGDYSDSSASFARDFAKAHDFTLLEIDLPDDYGFDVPDGSRAAKRAPCSACGLSKRHLFNEAALSNGYNVLATGHNLDDEAAVLFGNVLRWDAPYLGRQHPVLPAADGFARKVKPLVRLGERELAAYCVLTGIDYIVEECPMAAGNRHLGYKERSTRSRRSPGEELVPLRVLRSPPAQRRRGEEAEAPERVANPPPDAGDHRSAGCSLGTGRRLCARRPRADREPAVRGR